MRNRYLQENSDRFLSRDTWDGNSRDPQSLHKYLYANGSPTNYLDPSGNFSLTELAVASTIVGVLNAAAQGLWSAARGENKGQVVASINRGFTQGFLATLTLGFGYLILARVGLIVVQGITPVIVTAERWAHVLENHFPGGPKAVGGLKSIFYPNVNAHHLIRQAVQIGDKILQPNGNYKIVVDNIDDVGVDMMGVPVSVYTVIVNSANRLITMYPGAG